MAAANLHVDAPMTLARVRARYRWLLPVVAGAVLLLTLGALFGALPWDPPITAGAVDARDASLDRVFLRISWFGSTRVVVAVSLAAAALAWRRCPRLALAILVIALARPLTEWGLKELVARDRPAGDRLVTGTGHSFPSGHPMATAASWGLLPLVVALYTRRRLVWWTVAVGVWVLAVAVAISRVWLGVHWTSDVVAGLLLAVLGVAAAERFVAATHRSRVPCSQMQRVGVDEVEVDDVDQVDDSRLTTSTRT